MQKILLWFILIIAAAQITATATFWYITHPWIDIPMHILGGAWLALLFFYLFGERWTILPRHPVGQIVFAVGFVALVGVGWELFEYLVSVYVAKHFAFGGGTAPGHFDSLKDLFDDIVGGFTAAVLVVYLSFPRRRE